ncbi:MAG: transporter substrate-binding domain-containing protein, partial [Parasporobacterium sp.]|nr:transporter substrate-binding domain-containing protein [Parasporobacterium sp.]
INWDSKEMELENKNIDCVWNGMTLTDGVKEAMETSNAYCNNAQVVVTKADKADAAATVEACKELSFAVEAGSAGEEQATENGFNSLGVETQADAVMEVAAGTADACIIDSLMAGAMVGEGTSYPNLTTTVALNEELYGVGFRKGSDMAASLNEFFKAAYADGSMVEIAKKYGTQESVIEQK